MLFRVQTLADRVLVKPHELDNRLPELIGERLRAKVEGVCTQHGYVKQGSVCITGYMPGMVQAAALNGNVVYNVSFKAHVCNPVAGQVLEARVVSKNRFGLLGECGAEPGAAAVVEVVVTKDLPGQADLVDALQPGDTAHVEVLGHKYDLGSRKITVLGKLLSAPPPPSAAAAVAAATGSSPSWQPNDGEQDADACSVGPDDSVCASELVEDEDDDEDEDEDDEDDGEDGGGGSVAADDDSDAALPHKAKSSGALKSDSEDTEDYGEEDGPFDGDELSEMGDSGSDSD